jgi:hypothetical protein
MKNRVCQKQRAAVFPACLWRFVCAALFASCAATPAAPPGWFTRGAEAAFPRDAYIAEEGRGTTAKLAEQDAYAAISRYFFTRVTSRTQSRQTWASGAGYEAQVSDEALVQSAVKLFTLRRTAPWYDRGEKTYSVVAYIDRAEAWTVLEPRIKKEVDEFRALWHIAETETIVLKSYFDYKRAGAHTRRQEFTETVGFGELVNARGTAALTAEIRGNIAGLSAKLNEARNMAQIRVECPRDFESLLSTAIAKSLGEEGLVITTDKKMAAALCTVTVDDGLQRGEGDGVFFCYPKCGVVITDNAGRALFSYSSAPGRQNGMTADVAKRRAYGAIAADIERDFIARLNKGLGVQ